MYFITLPILAIIFAEAIAAPSDNSFVVSSTVPSTENGKEVIPEFETAYPVIYAMDIHSNISNRFAKTLVVSRIKNAGKTANETTFTVVLPEKAFISEFVMEIGGKNYTAYVKGKEEAKYIYNKAVAGGQSAGHVAVSARDSNRFTVSVNVEPESKAAFYLTYEELLERKDNQYELVLNIRPGQIVKDLNVQVLVNESRPLRFVRTPSLRSGNEISKNEDKLDPSTDIKIINSTSAIVSFSPDPASQRQFGIDLGVKENEGLAGQFIVQYDVERDPRGGEVLLQDGYFVHFFAPEDLEPLPKHVVFVLDTSGSMSYRSMEQLKDAMNSILDQLGENDIFHITEFNSDVFVWNIDTEESVTVDINNYLEPFEELTKNHLPSAMSVRSETIRKAKNVMNKISSTGITNMIGALETGLYLIRMERNQNKDKGEHQPIMIFLTDGYPNGGISSTQEITEIVTRLNAEHQIPIFSLSFGDGCDKKFLREISHKNLGFSRHIYEASDASLQLQDFYRQISSPLLSNVNFKYDSDVDKVTKTIFPIYFEGSEIVVSGCFTGPTLRPSIHGRGTNGTLVLSPSVETPVTSLERLWAYLTVKQKLQERETTQDKTGLTKEILDLALKYSFVTDVTSLVVVKPNDTNTVEAEDASDLPSSKDYNLRSNGQRISYSASPRAGYPGVFHQRRFFTAQGLRLRNNGLPYDNVFSSRSDIAAISHDGSSSDNVLMLKNHLTTSTMASPVPSMERSLPWLSSVLDANNSLTISGGRYDIGENRTVMSSPDCPETPLIGQSEAGHCTLLKDCPEVHHLLIDFKVYQRYFCPLETKYAGVCCPKSWAP